MRFPENRSPPLRRISVKLRSGLLRLAPTAEGNRPERTKLSRIFGALSLDNQGERMWKVGSMDSIFHWSMKIDEGYQGIFHIRLIPWMSLHPMVKVSFTVHDTGQIYDIFVEMFESRDPELLIIVSFCTVFRQSLDGHLDFETATPEIPRNRAKNMATELLRYPHSPSNWTWMDPMGG